MGLEISKETQIKRARLYPDVIRLHLDEARLCVNCDTIHTGDNCPVCASSHYVMLSSVIGRLPQNLPLKKDSSTCGHPVNTVTLAGLNKRPSATGKNPSSFMFQFLHLLSWLK